jgi:hypothetical protein
VRRLLRPVCWLIGHYNRASMLPEEVFGYSAYSRLWCGRCGRIEAERPIEDQIGVLMGYVTLWNDVRPIIEATRAYLAHDGSGVKRQGRWAGDYDAIERAHALGALHAAIEKYESLYPEHIKP